MILEFSCGVSLAFCDPRRLGRIRLRNNHLSVSPISDLAIDPYLCNFEEAYVFEKLSKITAPIKGVLLEQDRVFCGIGNYLADEILYQAEIHPKVASNSLDHHQIKRLVQCTKSIISTAVSLQCDGKDYPSEWLFHYRWDKGKNQGKGPIGGIGGCKLPVGQKVTYETIAGRTTAVVLSVQKQTSKGSKDSNVDPVAVLQKDAVSKTKKRMHKSVSITDDAPPKRKRKKT